MKPIPVEKPRFKQDRSVMMLDDAEMALELIDLAQTTTLRDAPAAAAPAARPAAVQPADLLAEVYSVAGYLLDSEQCDELARELELRQSTPPSPPDNAIRVPHDRRSAA